MEVARLVGAAVQDELGLAVDLTHPELELHVDAYEHELFVSVDRLRGGRRASGRDFRAGAGAALGRDRLARRRLPDDEARPAL